MKSQKHIFPLNTYFHYEYSVVIEVSDIKGIIT